MMRCPSCQTPFPTELNAEGLLQCANCSLVGPVDSFPTLTFDVRDYEANTVLADLASARMQFLKLSALGFFIHNPSWGYALHEAMRGEFGSGAGLPTELGIAELVATSNGIFGEQDWLAVFRLDDSEFAFLHASADENGWEGEAQGSLDMAPTLPALCANIDAADLERLGLDAQGNPVDPEMASMKTTGKKS